MHTSATRSEELRFWLSQPRVCAYVHIESLRGRNTQGNKRGKQLLECSSVPAPNGANSSYSKKNESAFEANYVVYFQRI